jgi:hypothetical protein
MSAAPVTTLSAAIGDIFAEGTIKFTLEEVMGWRAYKPYPGPTVSVTVWWQKSGNPIQNASRMVNVRKHVIPLLTEAWAPAKENEDA